MNASIKNGTTILSDSNGLKKRMTTQDFFKYIYKKMDSSELKSRTHKHIIDKNKTLHLEIQNNEVISTSEYITLSIPQKQYNTTYKKKFYKIWLPEIECNIKMNNDNIDTVIITCKNKVLNLPNMYSDGKICIGTIKTECDNDLESIKKWIVSFISSEWNTDLWSPDEFKTIIELFEWLEIKRKNYDKIIYKNKRGN